MQLNKYECLKQQLLLQQETIEKTSMDTLNQHDKVAAMVKMLTDELDHMISRLEALNYGMETIAKDINSKEVATANKEITEFSRMINQQEEQLDAISKLTQSIMEGQAAESEVIHEMEQQIAKQREVLEMQD